MKSSPRRGAILPVMKRILLLTLSLLLVTLGASAQRGPGGPGAPPPPPGAGPRANDAALADYLGLTATQKEAWKTIQSELRASGEALHDQARALHDQLDTALAGNDSAAAGSLMLQLRAIREQLKAAREAAEAKFTALLTTEQKAKFEAFQAAVEYLRQRGPGGGPHP